MARRRTARSGRNGTKTLRNIDITDRELLFNIADAVEADGWATTTGVALECGFPPADPSKRHETPARKVATRLAYMRDMGLLESTGPDLSRPYRDAGDRDTRWKLTPMGNVIRSGSLSPAVERALATLDPGGQVMLQRALTQQAYISGDATVAATVRREIQNGFAQRRLVVRGR